MAAAKHTPWKIYICSPRKGERSLRLVPRRWINGKRKEGPTVFTETTDRGKAERLALIYQADMNGSESVGLADVTDPTIGQLVRLRIESLRAEKASPNTIKGYRAALKAIGGSLGDCPASELNKARLMQVQTTLLRKLGSSTVSQYLRQAAAAWRWAQDADLLPPGKPWPRLGRQRKVKAKKTEKRPYTDAEVFALLAWIAGYLGGRWLPIFQLLADTGARVGAVLGLRGQDVERGAEPKVHFRVQWIADPDGGVAAGGWRKLKTGETRSVPIMPETAALLPRAEKGRPLWPNARDHRRPRRIEAVRDVLRKAIKAVGIADAENVDTHSLRRAWVRTAKRQGVPDAVGMRVTGHKEQQVYDGYDRNSGGDDLREVVQRVHDARRLASELLVAGSRRLQSVGDPAEDLEAVTLGVLAEPEGRVRPVPAELDDLVTGRATVRVGQVHDRSALGHGKTPGVAESSTCPPPVLGTGPLVAVGCGPISSSPRKTACGPQPEAQPELGHGERVEGRRALSHQGTGRRERIWGRLDPVVATVARWSDEDPAAMRRLLSDPELRAHLATALNDLAPDPVAARHERRA